MSKTKFTPGPWSINEWPQATSDIAIGAVGTPLIAKVPLRDVSINEQKANANLIKSAPDLYEALDGLLADITEYQEINFLGGENNHWQVRARAALAKARGEG